MAAGKSLSWPRDRSIAPSMLLAQPSPPNPRSAMYEVVDVFLLDDDQDTTVIVVDFASDRRETWTLTAVRQRLQSGELKEIEHGS